MSWIALSLMAAVMWSGVILFDKFVVDNEIQDPFVDVSINGIGLYSVLLFAGLMFGKITFSPYAIAGGAAVGLFYVSSIFFYYRGMQTEEVSRFAPMIALSTIFVAIISYFLIGESFTPLTYLGMALAVAGAFLISLEDPVHSLKNLESKKGFLIGIIVAILFSFREVSFKYFSADISFLSLIFWTGLSGLALSILIILFKRNSIHRSRGAAHLGFIGLMAGTGFLLFTRAISIGPVSLASAIVRSQPLFVFFGSVLITVFYPDAISEKIDRSTMVQKLVAVLMAVTGLLIITLL